MKLCLVMLIGLSQVAFAATSPSKCQVLDRSILSRTSSGIPAVSNVKPIEISCTAPARPFPTKPGESRNGLNAATTALLIAPDGSRKVVPTQTEGQGGGRGAMYGATDDEEFVTFYIFIPLEREERDFEIRRYLDRFEAAGNADLDEPEPDRQEMHARVEYLKAHPEEFAVLMTQSRLGHFKIDCRVMDGDSVVAVGSVELEVVFKGRISDAFPPKGAQTH